MMLIKLLSGYKDINTNKSSNTMKPTPRQYKEAVERHDKIVKHLIDEGYAENPEMADNIIMGMSEEWYELILKNSGLLEE